MRIDAGYMTIVFCKAQLFDLRSDRAERSKALRCKTDIAGCNAALGKATCEPT